MNKTGEENLVLWFAWFLNAHTSHFVSVLCLDSTLLLRKMK